MTKKKKREREFREQNELRNLWWKPCDRKSYKHITRLDVTPPFKKGIKKKELFTIESLSKEKKKRSVIMLRKIPGK